MRRSFDEEFSALAEGMFARRPEDFPPGAFTFENFMWGAAIVSSRAYGDDEDGSFLAVPPLVDFLNHQAGALQLTRFGNGIVAYAHKHYDKGEEAFINYGGKANAQLLSQYGFLIDGNADEAVFLRLGEHLLIEEPLADQKRGLLEQLFGDGVDADTAILKLARRPREWLGLLLPVVRALALTAEDEVPENAWDLQAPQQARLEDAKARLAEGWPSGGISERNSLGLRLQISEQELLAEALVQVAERKEEALAMG
ncbi:unnamed protein product [Prorocentrum cordatum]|uniref:SET domain-containing protein n=1 Tax=Prorocentrum cordatum TaxID=2364126 RepID=A0ABN9T7P8_9DINO|nr:unnamed protein product [Polarella glacialis]